MIHCYCNHIVLSTHANGEVITDMNSCFFVKYDEQAHNHIPQLICHAFNIGLVYISGDVSVYIEC
jgi:hypothetical protein